MARDDRKAKLREEIQEPTDTDAMPYGQMLYSATRRSDEEIARDMPSLVSALKAETKQGCFNPRCSAMAVIKSHSLHLSGPLKIIGEKGHVFRVRPRWTGPGKAETWARVVGLGDASVFKLLCASCDNKLFAEVDVSSQPRTPSVRYQRTLLLRAVLRAYWERENYFEALLSFVSSGLNHARPEQQMNWTLRQVRLGCDDLKKLALGLRWPRERRGSRRRVVYLSGRTRQRVAFAMADYFTVFHDPYGTDRADRGHQLVARSRNERNSRLERDIGIPCRSTGTPSCIENLVGRRRG